MVVYDLNGAEVKTLVSENVSAGSYQVVWNGLNNTGQNVASGRYIVKMSAPGFSDTITMTLLK
jgi:flagellar hook assembly protein FlgD